MVMGDIQQERKDHLQLTTHGGKEYKFEKVNNFVYLRVVIKEEGKQEVELKGRIAKGNRKYGSMKTLMNTKLLKKRMKK